MVYRRVSLVKVFLVVCLVRDCDRCLLPFRALFSLVFFPLASLLLLASLARETSRHLDRVDIVIR